MTSQFSPKVSEILAYSREEAVRLSCNSVTPEHLLLGMMRINDGPVYDVFSRLNIKKEDLEYLALRCSNNKSKVINGYNPIGYQEMLDIYRLAYPKR